MLQRLGSFFTQKSPVRESGGDSSSSQTPREGFSTSGSQELSSPDRVEAKRMKIERVLCQSQVDLKQLRSLLWSGVPADLRLQMWFLGLGVLPAQTARHAEILENRKRDFFSDRKFPPQISDSLRQLQLDFPRTFTDDPDFFTYEISVHQAILVWVTRNPGIAYFQGLNDLCVPMLKVIKFWPTANNSETAFYLYSLISRILEDMQDHYVFGQPGIQRCIARISALLFRVDPPLFEHLKAVDVDLLTVLFRWINCLFVREFSGLMVLRVWDVCIADELGFRDFAVYLSLAMLGAFRGRLLEAVDAVAVMEVFRTSPSLTWGAEEVETLLAEAFVLKSVWERSNL